MKLEELSFAELEALVQWHERWGHLRVPAGELLEGEGCELREATPDEVDEYRRKLRTILDRSDALDDHGIAQARELLRQLQEAVIGRIHTTIGQTEWTQFYLPRLLSALEGVAGAFADRYGQELTDLLPHSFQVGTDLVDEGLSGLGFQAQLPAIDRTSVEVLSQFSPDLVKGLEATTMDSLKKTLSLSLAQGDSLDALMQKLRKDVTLQDSPFKSVRYRTEIIARTEISRVQGLASQARMEQVQTHPGLKVRKQFLSAHIGEYPCPQCAEYDGKVFDVDDPNAPEVPVHPNCRCVFAPSVERA